MKKSRIDLLHACRNYLQAHALVQPGQSVLVALSGGVDSMVLCALLRELSDSMAFRLAVAHFNHHLRGADSDEDEQFVLRMAAEWGLTAHSGGADVANWSADQGQSVETGARILRYQFLLDLAEKMSYDRVATGHNADDQAETVLDHFLRGAGVTGLCGMPRRRDRIIRPLLFADRRWISAFAEQHAVPFRRDSSNDDQAYRRNRLRHDLLPHLQQYNPRIRRTLTRLSGTMTEVDEYLNAMAEKAFGECCIQDEGGKIILDCQLFLAYFIILKKYLLRLCLSKLVDDEPFFDHALYDRALSILSGTGGQAYAVLGSRVFIEKVGKLLIIGRRPPPCAEVRIDRLQGTFPLWDGRRLRIFMANETLSTIRRNQDKKRAWVDGDKLTLPLTLRPMRDADRFRPLHLAGSKSLSDFFIDEKVPRHLRRRIPILWSGDQVVWVCGQRLDDRFKVTAETTRIYELRLAEQCESEIGI
ncbi:tRNA lysidine(34) synthetase TilS [bacterium]|nr:tRNA lysidine(34) synthetase TilS [bacterium]